MSLFRFSWRVLQEAAVQVKRGLGRSLRQTGLQLDRMGSRRTNDIAYLEPINRHRNILNIDDYRLALSPSVSVAPNATVYGNVAIGQDTYVGFGAVVDGLFNPVRVGSNTKIGDNSTVQAAFWVPDEAFPLSTTIGNNVNIEHHCSIVNAIIDDNVHIGFKTVVMEGCQIERGVVIAPNSYVPAGSRLPQNTQWAGNPVQFVKNLDKYDSRIEEEQPEQIKLEIPTEQTTQ